MPSVSQYKYNRKKTKINKKLGLDLLSWDMASLRVLFCSCRPLNPVLPIIALKNSPDSLIMPATLPLKHICHLRKNLQYKNQWKNIHPLLHICETGRGEDCFGLDSPLTKLYLPILPRLWQKVCGGVGVKTNFNVKLWLKPSWTIYEFMTLRL